MLLMYAIIVDNEYAEYVDLIVWEPNSENCSDFISAAPTSAIRKFMLDMPSPGISQNIGL